MVERYEKVRLLGKGSFGKVWVVREKSSPTQLVMKEIRPQNKQELQEALSEAEIMHKLRHRNIIQYREVINVTPKLVLILMEFAPNGDIMNAIDKQKLYNKRFPEDQILRWITEALQALAYIHGEGMVHRDIKTANLFLAADSELKLGDFGISRELEQNAMRMTMRTCTSPVGSPMYMSPEQCQGDKYGQRADIWALGCVLYELMTLKPAFMAPTLQSLMHRIKRGRIEADQIPEMYSAGVKELLALMLTVDELQRPTARALLAVPVLRPYLPADDPAQARRASQPVGANDDASDPKRIMSFLGAPYRPVRLSSPFFEEDELSASAKNAPAAVAALPGQSPPAERRKSRSDGAAASAAALPQGYHPLSLHQGAGKAQGNLAPHVSAPGLAHHRGSAASVSPALPPQPASGSPPSGVRGLRPLRASEYVISSTGAAPASLAPQQQQQQQQASPARHPQLLRSGYDTPASLRTGPPHRGSGDSAMPGGIGMRLPAMAPAAAAAATPLGPDSHPATSFFQPAPRKKFGTNMHGQPPTQQSMLELADWYAQNRAPAAGLGYAGMHAAHHQRAGARPSASNAGAGAPPSIVNGQPPAQYGAAPPSHYAHRPSNPW